MEVIIQISIGVFAGLLTAALLRFLVRAFDFVPRKLHDIGIGSSFEPFIARGPGDNYDDVLWFRIRNHSAAPLFIVRAVYFPRNTGIPVYENATKSQKYENGYEVKFGQQYQDMTFLLMPKGDTQSYIPLSSGFDETKFPQEQRGELIIEYVHDGKTGIHKAKL
ncbi:MAG TPA: hypothetical protein ENJ28_09585 [Gammaproteobacteria bacterium]|nr:hypothetical protein [Gammaproteobacteria bacterium]